MLTSRNNQIAKKIARKFVSLTPLEWRQAIMNKIKAELKPEIKAELKPEIKAELKPEITAELKPEIKAELKPEIKAELKPEIKAELKSELERRLITLYKLPQELDKFCVRIKENKEPNKFDAQASSLELRSIIRSAAGLAAEVPNSADTNDLFAEFGFLKEMADLLRPAFNAVANRRVLFCGQAYYNAWYLSRALRELGLKADVYNWDSNRSNDLYYHGEDFRLGVDVPLTLAGELGFYLDALYGYDVIHFSNAHGIAFSWGLQSAVKNDYGDHEEIYLLRALGKIVVYSNNGCLDGVSQTSFSKWRPENVCSICRWQDEPSVCSDERNLAWGAFRNSVADYQCTLGGNRADYNDDVRVHEVPEFYCLDPNLWHPDVEIPAQYKLPKMPVRSVRLYHAVGNLEARTRSDGTNIKSTHIYLPLIKKLREEGAQIELINPTGLPNKEIRFLQAQADIFLEMLTFGWFGANAREAMMLGKPVICFIRPEWLESVREEIPDYAAELPIISATPQTVEAVLSDLIADKEKRREIGMQSRDFALKWHSATAAGRRFDEIYRELLAGNPLHRKVI